MTYKELKKINVKCLENFMQNPKDIFLNFTHQMKNWEIDMAEALKKYGVIYVVEGEFPEKMRQKLINIQEIFLSQKALSLPQERRIIMNFGEPPEYDQVIFSEKLISNKKYEIISIQNGDDNLQYKYILVLESNSWKVDTVAHSWMNWRATRKLF